MNYFGLLLFLESEDSYKSSSNVFTVYSSNTLFTVVALLQHGADPSIRNTEGKTAVEVAEAGPHSVLTGEHRKEELL